MLFSSSHDTEADALYLTLDHGDVARTIEFDSGTLADLDADGRPLGLEVIHPHRQWPVEEIIRRLGLSESEAEGLRLHAKSFWAPPPAFGRFRRVSSGSGRISRLTPISA